MVNLWMFLTKNKLNKSEKSPWQLKREATGFQICQQLSPEPSEKPEKAFKWKTSHINSGELIFERQKNDPGDWSILSCAKWESKCNIRLQKTQRVFFNILSCLLHTSVLILNFVFLGQSSFFPSCHIKSIFALWNIILSQRDMWMHCL